MLPYLGLGLATNLGARDLPDPLAVHAVRPDLLDFVEYSAPLDLAEAARAAPRFEALRGSGLPVLFHPVHLNLYGPALESDETLGALAAHARAVGSPWVGNDVAWWHAAGASFPGYLYLPPPLDTRGLADCAAHAAHVQDALDRPLLLENPVVLERSGPLHVLDFMAALHAQSGCELILDLGHLLAFQLAAALPLRAGLDGFPLDAVREIHLAGGTVTGRAYADDHGQPVREELFELLSDLLPRCRALCAVTFEGDGHPDEVAQRTLERLRPLLSAPPEARDASAPEHARGPPPPPDWRPASDPWSVFERLYAHRGPSPDPAGTRADQDLRLAVLAEALDRDWPLTRPLLCPDRERLAEFSGSPELRARFESGARPLAQAFGAWARRHLREAPDDGAERAVSFESWARALAGADWREGTFPLDLGELVFAVRALRRHLGARAAATGVFEASALEALAQIARRAPSRPWRVAVRFGPAGLEAREAGLGHP
ncbi:MAG TPA: DUF692 family protein [Myxococcales bacterium]|nr:DUF692 family protein [Myxococcales bacterium]